MKQSRLLLFFLSLVLFLTAHAALGAEIIFPLEEPFQYTREIGPELFYEHSQVDIYIENVYDPLRWKQWYIEIWLPDYAGDLTEITVDYKLPGEPEILIPGVPVLALDREQPWPVEMVGVMKGFYADTWDPLWEQYMTSPVESGGPYPIGNPEWLSFHFFADLPVEDPFGLYVFDKCIPEPISLMLLGTGGLALLRRRKM